MTDTYVGDRANRLKSMGGVSYNYDGDGDRTWRVANEQATLYMLDKQAPLTVILNEQTGSNFHRYIHGPTGILAQQNPNGDMRWLLQDGLQSVRGVSDGVNILSAQAYSPYGEPMFADRPTEFGFTGEQTDPLNDLVYLRARYMNPKLGIFGSLDPFEGEESEPLTMNAYSWVEGNAVNLIDRTGNMPEHFSKGEAGFGACPTGYVHAGPTCVPVSALEQICSASDLHQARLISSPLMNVRNNQDFDLWLSKVKAACILDSDDTSLEKLADLSDFVASAYNDNRFVYMDIMSEVVIGSRAGTGAAARSVQAGGCAGWGREPKDCPANEKRVYLTDSGFHSDFQDGRNQVYHFWGGVASMGRMQNIVDFAYTYPLNYMGFQVFHEIMQGVACNMGLPGGESGGSWMDFALTEKAFSLGYEISTENISPNMVGNWMRTELGKNGPGWEHSIADSQSNLPLPAGRNATCPANPIAAALKPITDLAQLYAEYVIMALFRAGSDIMNGNSNGCKSNHK